jgi:DNA (cytosine-5)-methyltransferase 1
LRGYLETGNKKRKGPAADAGASSTAGCWWDGGQVSQTLDAVLAKGQTMPEKNRFPAVLTPVSHWDGGHVHPTLNQFAKGSGGVGSSNQELFSQGGAYLVPGQPFSVAFGGAKLEHTAPTIMANGGPNRHGEGSWSSTQFTGVIQPDTRTTHAVVQPHIVQASELRLRGQITEQDTCPTLLANTKSGDNDPLAVQAITFQPGNLRREAGADPSTTTTTTLKASAGDQTPHVAIAFDGYNQTLSETSQTIRADKSDCDHVGMVLTPMAVRRLTPVECERLQGFPDNWSRISWKGKPEEQCPDGPRYKACGNSMAVPCMRWIGERIAAVDATL